MKRESCKIQLLLLNTDIISRVAISQQMLCLLSWYTLVMAGQQWGSSTACLLASTWLYYSVARANWTLFQLLCWELALSLFWSCHSRQELVIIKLQCVVFQDEFLHEGEQVLHARQLLPAIRLRHDPRLLLHRKHWQGFWFNHMLLFYRYIQKVHFEQRW